MLCICNMGKIKRLLFTLQCKQFWQAHNGDALWFLCATTASDKQREACQLESVGRIILAQGKAGLAPHVDLLSIAIITTVSYFIVWSRCQEKHMKWKAFDGLDWQDRKIGIGRSSCGCSCSLLSHRGGRARGAAIKGRVGELDGISWIQEIRAASPHRHEVPCEL